MHVTRKIPFAVRNLALVAALSAVCGPASALVADGKLGSATNTLATAAQAAVEGYTKGWSVDYVDKNGKSVGTGQIWFGTDGGGNQFVYYMLPLTYVDNTYGTNSSAGWGGPGGHKFNDLLGSDSMGGASVMQWTDQNNGGATSTARIDYIANCSSTPAICDTNNTNGTNSYRSGGVGTGTGAVAGTNGAAASWGSSDDSLTGSAASILEIATSLEYNLQNVDPTATTNSSTLPGWLTYVGYELEFAPGTFNPGTFGNLTVSADGKVLSSPGLLFGDPHVSPPMGNSVATFRPPCLIGSSGCTVPEPSTPLLLAGGLAAMAWYARRRNVHQRSDLPLMSIVSS